MEGGLFVVGIGCDEGTCVEEEAQGLVDVGESFFELFHAHWFFHDRTIADEEASGEDTVGSCKANPIAEFGHQCIVNECWLGSEAESKDAFVHIILEGALKRGG